MILIPHLVFGAAVGSLVKNPFLAVILAFLSHYLLDFIPHVDYSVENIKKMKWQPALPEFLFAFADLSTGIIFVFMFSGGQPIVYICAAFSILSDVLNFLNSFYPNKFLKTHSDFHHKKIHFLSNDDEVTEKKIKISVFWRILSQIAVVVISVFLF